MKPFGRCLKSSSKLVKYATDQARAENERVQKKRLVKNTSQKLRRNSRCRGLSLAPVYVYVCLCVCACMVMLCPEKTYLSSSVVSVCLGLLEVHV